MSDGSKKLAAVGLTQHQIASRVGAHQSDVARWISGERIPAEKYRKLLLSAFGIRVSDWVRDEWIVVTDVVIEVLSKKAPDLLKEILDEIEKRIAS